MELDEVASNAPGIENFQLRDVLVRLPAPSSSISAAAPAASEADQSLLIAAAAVGRHRAPQRPVAGRDRCRRRAAADCRHRRRRSAASRPWQLLRPNPSMARHRPARRLDPRAQRRAQWRCAPSSGGTDMNATSRPLCLAALFVAAGTAGRRPILSDRSVRIVVAYPAGGPTDVMARLVGKSCRMRSASNSTWRTTAARRHHRHRRRGQRSCRRPYASCS